MTAIRDKRRVVALLRGDDTEAILKELATMDPGSLVNALFSGICHADEAVKWHAVTAMGPTVARIADANMEAARVIMRRFMWSLNDESGGIGWGAPESMGEVLACHEGLAGEYTNVLVAYMREDGFHLELEALQRGLMWGLGRLAQVRPAALLCWQAADYLPTYLEAGDHTVRGLATWTLGLLKAKETKEKLQKLQGDSHPVRHYLNRQLVTTTVGELAAQAVERMKNA